MDKPRLYIQNVFLLAALAGIGSGLVAVGTAPARLAVADRPLSPVGLADPVQTVDLPTGFAARHHAWLHLGFGKVLQLVVDVQVLDAAVEAGAILDLPEAEGCRVHVHGHP